MRSPGFYARLAGLGVLALTAFGVLALRLWSLQILRSPSLAGQAMAQASRTIHVPTTRGAILDAGGRTLVDADGRLEVTVRAPALGRGEGEAWRPTAGGRRLLRRLAGLAHTSLPALVGSVRRSLVRSPVAPPVVLPRVGADLARYLQEHERELPGLQVVVVPTRRYPQGAIGSEFLGLLGEIDAHQLGEPSYRGYAPGDVVGQSGIEASYDRLLGGPSRRARVLVDSLGRPRSRPRLVGSPPPLRSLQLTVRLPLQRAAEQAIRDGVALARAAGHADASGGAAVVLDPWTGAIEALASDPGFDQERAATDPRYLAGLLAGRDPSRPLLDRATQGAYPPGSTFKPFVAEAGLASGLISPTSPLACTSSLLVGNHVFHNVEAGIDATLTLPQALSISCDTWFYRLGTMLDARRVTTGRLDLEQWAARFGFGQPTGIDVPGETAGLVGSPRWLERTIHGPAGTWYVGDTVNMSIGQGYLTVTPLQLAVAYAALANGGTIVRPHLGRAVLDASNRVVRTLRFPPRRRLHLVGLQAIRDGLFMAAHDPGGTSAGVFSSFPVPVVGKTGTAESPPGSDDSWYASWAPAGHPRVVVVVLIEHGGFGAQAAAPAAREIYSAYFHVPQEAGG